MIAIEKEPFTMELMAEILPLAQRCWNESTLEKGESCAFYGEREFQIEPYGEMYQELSDKGALVLITLRVDGVLQGYVEGFTYRTMHHKKIIGALGDSIYIEPPFRSHASALINRFESEVKGMGAGIIGWPTQEGGAVYNVLKAKGYVGDDVVMEKRICASQQQ